MDGSRGAVQYEHILVPVDGSAFGRAALPTARALAELFAAQLVILSVAHAGEIDERRRSIDDSVGDDPTIMVEVVVGDDPAAAVVARARQLDATLVCMSTHGRGRVGGALLGSITRQVLQSCHVPIVTLGPQADRPPYLHARTGQRPASWPEPLSTGGVAACVDGSAESESVLAVAAGWALALDAELSIVTVTENPGGPPSGAQDHGVGVEDPQQYVEDLAQRWGEVLPTTHEVIVDPISVAAGINAYLARRDTAMVAVTTHARSGFGRVRLGATAADIVRRSTAPTLVVPLPST